MSDVENVFEGNLKRGYHPLNPQSVLSFGAKERTKENITPPRPPQGEDAIDFGQRPPYVKVLVCFTKLSP